MEGQPLPLWVFLPLLLPFSGNLSEWGGQDSGAWCSKAFLIAPCLTSFVLRPPAVIWGWEPQSRLRVRCKEDPSLRTVCDGNEQVNDSLSRGQDIVRILPTQNTKGQRGVLLTMLNSLVRPRRQSARQTCSSMVSLRWFWRGRTREAVCSWQPQLSWPGLGEEQQEGAETPQ